MKKVNNFCLVLCVLLTTNFVKGQSKFIEYTFQPSAAGSTTHPTTVSHGWMAPFNVADCEYGSIPNVNKNTGNINYLPVPLVNGLFTEVDDIIQIESNTILCAGFSGKFSDAANDFSPLIYEMDTSGNIIWVTPFNGANFGNQILMDAFTRVVPAADGSVYALAPNKYIGKTDANGKIAWLKSYTNVSDIAWSAKGLIAIAGSHILLLDTSGLLVNDFNFPGKNYKQLQRTPNGKICASGQGYACLLDTSFNKTDSVYFEFGFNEKMNGTYVLGSDSAFYYYDHDSLASLTLKGTLNWKKGVPSDNIISGLAYNGNQLAVAGNGPAPFIKTYDKNGNTSPINRDIAVTSATAPHVVMQKTNGTPDSLQMKDILADVDVMVKNLGTETIDSFYLQSIGPNTRFAHMFAVFCQDYLIGDYIKINLLPGNSVTLHTTISRQEVVPGKNGYTLDFLINAVSPNGKIDGNTANDGFHFSNIVTGIQQNKLTDQNIMIYPNPTSGILNIDNEGSMNIKNVEITNITGQEIANYQVINMHSEINLSNMSQGIYFAKIYTENGIVVRKIIKE